MTRLRMGLLGMVMLAALGPNLARSEETGAPLRKVGGFRCVNLASHAKDATFDLFRIGYWSHGSLAMDIWKRHGVPFWYPRGTGNVLVAGANWTPPIRSVLSSADHGGVAHADHQQPGNGAIANANDDNSSTYWYAGDKRPFGNLWIEFKEAKDVASVRFLGWPTGRHAPKDYAAGLILPDGRRQEIASVRDEKRMGQWLSFDAGGVAAKGVYVDVTSTVDNEHGPVIYELQALPAAPGEPAKQSKKRSWPSEVEIPLGGVAAQELFVMGNVGNGFDSESDAGKTVGQYVVSYESGDQEVIPLVVGKNLAHWRYGHFVPEAEFAYALQDTDPPESATATGLYYHLDELAAVEPKWQLQMFSHRLGRPESPIKSLTFRATDAEAGLYLVAVTLRQSGPRMNALFYNGRMVRPYPADTPVAPPSPLAALRKDNRTLSLDGPWQYRTDPGNRGVREEYFAPDYDASAWQTMAVPSQWYVQGLDYHGVVWYRREFDLPATFPGSVLELCFGGVDYDARVWVNGQYVGRHVGAYAAFQLDATEAVRKGATNTIVVRVDSPIDPGFAGQKTLLKGNAMDDIAMPYGEEGCMGGIYRSVRLRGRGSVGLRDVWTRSKLSDDLRHAVVTIGLDLLFNGPNEKEVAIRCRLSEADGQKTHEAEMRCIAAPNATTPAELVIEVDDPKLWYPWEQGEPYLYTMEVEVRREAEVLDRHVSRVGIREVAFDDQKDCLLVNHHRIFLKGMLNDDVHWMSLMDRTGYRQRIALQRDANLNVIRVVTHQSSPEMYELCDEVGMMVWQEMPLQWGYSQSAPVREDILDVVRETMVQTRGHACVVGYSAWNEGGQRGFSEQVVSLMKSLDGTRPVSRACGGGDWDIHIYPNLAGNLSRMTPLWSGVKVAFVSEVGAYGLSSLEEMHSILGDDLFPFDSAHYYWDTFSSYRYNDGPVFLDAPRAGDWPTDKIQQYVVDHQAASERWLVQFMKYMYENFRGLRFNPTTAAIHCRFDDPLPTAFLGVVNFTGRPRKAYEAVREACQPVLPILFFDYTGAEDVRVVNEYWHRSWQGCTLKYVLKTRDGRTLKHLERQFDLPADATVKVLTREEAGDLWHLPGFFAELQVAGPDGTVLSENHYDLTEDEIRAFVTTVYPLPPEEPVDAILLKATDVAAQEGAVRPLKDEGTYSDTLLELGAAGEACELRFDVEVPAAGEYLVRVACGPGGALNGFELTIEEAKAEREQHAFIDMTQGITRVPYGAHALSWRPGWRATLSPGSHKLVLRRAGGQGAPPLVLDAVCLQPSRQ